MDNLFERLDNFDIDELDLDGFEDDYDEELSDVSDNADADNIQEMQTLPGDEDIFVVPDILSLSSRLSQLQIEYIRASAYSDLTIRECEVIHTIYNCIDRDSCNHSLYIAQALGISPGSLTICIKTLSSKGYVRRVTDAADRRIVHIELTEKGMNACAAYKEYISSLDMRIRELLNQKEHTELSGMLRLLLKNL